MKLTIDIPADSVAALRAMAASADTSLDAIVQRAIEEYLAGVDQADGSSKAASPQFKLRDESFHGNGLHPSVDLNDFDAMLRRSYGLPDSNG